MKIQYSPDAVDRLKEIKTVFGEKYYQDIRKAVRGLSSYPEKGPSVEKYIGVSNPYRFLHEAQHYVFYRIDNSNKTINVTDIYNEKEDFLRRLFGISLRTPESKEYWGE